MFQKHDSPFNQTFRRKSHLFSFKKSPTVDMTNGSIFQHLIRFAVPMLLGSIFSLLYSTIDSWVIGNFGSSESYAAIGAAGPIINILTWGSGGLGSGVSVYIGQKIGARRINDIDRIVHTVCFSFFLLGLSLSFIGLMIADPALELLGTPQEIRQEALIYMSIYFLLMGGNMFNGACANILRSFGKSGTPVLIGSAGAVANTVLDLLFVIVFQMGIAGVAIATLIVVYAESVLYIIALLKNDFGIVFRFSKFRVDWRILRPVFALGLPIAIQQSINSISGAMIQSYVNHFGSDYIAAWYTYRKFQSFTDIPIGPLVSAISVFVAQNAGALKYDRIQRSVRISVLMCIVICAFLTVLSVPFAVPLAAFFNRKEEVVTAAARLITWFSPLLVFNYLSGLYIAFFRGMGNTRTPMILSVSTFTVFRQICMIAMLKLFDDFYLVTAAFPFTWLVADAIICPYFYAFFKRKRSALPSAQPVAEPQVP